MMISVWTDGAARPNPGKGGVGIIIRGENWDYTLSKKIDDGKVSSNEAEYSALCVALTELMKNNLINHEITVYSDAELLTLQMSGQKEVDRGGKYVKNYLKAKEFSEYFTNLRFQWIPREENTEANMLASKALKNVF